MKYLKELSKLKIFTYDDFVNVVGNSALANVTIQNYIKKGYVKRIKRNLYCLISLETSESSVNKFIIGSSLTNSSFISFHSAFEFYGYYNQVYSTVEVSSISKFNPFCFENTKYNFIKTKTDKFVESIRGVKVSTIERTIVDSIKYCNKYIELEELLNCINLIPYIYIDDILDYLSTLNSKILYKKVGIILSLYKDKLNIPQYFFDKCYEKSNNVKGYFDKNKNMLEYDSNWKIYAYKDLINYVNKE